MVALASRLVQAAVTVRILLNVDSMTRTGTYDEKPWTWKRIIVVPGRRPRVWWSIHTSHCGASQVIIVTVITGRAPGT